MKNCTVYSSPRNGESKSQIGMYRDYLVKYTLSTVYSQIDVQKRIVYRDSLYFSCDRYNESAYKLRCVGRPIKILRPTRVARQGNVDD